MKGTHGTAWHWKTIKKSCPGITTRSVSVDPGDYDRLYGLSVKWGTSIRAAVKKLLDLEENPNEPIRP